MNVEKIIATIAAATFTLTIYADGGETVAIQATEISDGSIGIHYSQGR